MKNEETDRDALGAIEDALRRLAPRGAAFACGPVRDATDALFASERPPIARAVDKRRFEYSTGRWLAREALAGIGIAPVAIPDDGTRRPRWPDGVTGSISHSHRCCAVIVAPTRQVATLGLDIERVSSVAESLLRHVSHADERAMLARSVAEDVLPALLFSAREAVFKAYHPVTDHFLGFQDVRLSVEGDGFTAQILSPEIPRLFGQDRIAGRFAVAAGMIVSVVAVPAATLRPER